ncbi:MAG: DUF4157 domain-containing protein [Nitrospira sp.]|nr:DUF4157 domain-containing protein [Nitrospira sp.]
MSDGRRGERSCSCGNTCQDCRARQREQALPHAWTGTIPPLVPDVLASPGEPLESGLRGEMESRFGHDFGKVRVHRGGRAAASAEAVRARAYTVGHEIVLGSAAADLRSRDNLPLLGHELAHVVQQDKAFGDSRQSGLLQRAGLEQPNGGQDASAASGLPEPDCDTRVADLFLLGAIHCPQRPECCFAQVHDRKNHNLTGIFRADHELEGKPDCEYGDQKRHDFWLANHWRILEITTSDMTVMNMCGREETLNVEGIGTVKGEPASAVVPDRPPSSTSLPPHIVDHTQGMWGASNKIHYDDQCNSIHVVPNETGKETKVYRWDSAQESFVNEHDPADTKTPGQMERFAGIVLKEYVGGEWQGTSCGDLPRWAL